ncbi:MAG: winged helix-turn-helix domain-containing protein [Paracoccaceae bacterium]|nr:winged helix-turn-helix domain-containing protein [Paracoccaceae bacterium]
MNDPMPTETKLRLRVVFGDGIMIGPGKVELLEHIRDTGSISAAGRAMGMSYKRAWMLVEVMNAAFCDPLVASVRGGPQGGGAQLTETGVQVVAHYRAMGAKARAATAAEVDALRGMLKDMSGGK